MEIHWLDILFYFIGLILVWMFTPEDYKEGLGGLFGCFFILIYTIIYIIVFGTFDINIIDIWNSIKINITIQK